MLAYELGEDRINTSAPDSIADSKLMEYKLMTNKMCAVSRKSSASPTPLNLGPQAKCFPELLFYEVKRGNDTAYPEVTLAWWGPQHPFNPAFTL